MGSPSCFIQHAKRSAAHFRTVALLLLCGGATALAHETDQFSVPVGRQMADLRMFFADDVAHRIGDAVNTLNERIERTLQNGQPSPATQQYHSPEVVARTVYNRFPSVVLHVEQLEAELHSSGIRARHPGLVVAYRPTFWIYHHPLLLLDPTKLTRLMRCSTVMIDGHYLGTDKIVHFVHMGHIYYQAYAGAIRRGAGEADAVKQAIGLATGSNLFLSENTILGMFTTGVHSHADLAANYCGLKFFRNLTEPVMLRGETRPPMLVREGPYWRLNDHVRPNSDFFTWFVSDHWDEALLPNSYLTNMVQECVRQGVRARCPDLLEWYRNANGLRRTRDDFLRTTTSLQTYFGEDYGFNDDMRDMVTIGTVCFDQAGRLAQTSRRAAGDSQVVLASAVDSRRAPPDADALLRASCDGDLQKVQELLGRGANANAADIDGQTALHCAARWGHTQITELLLRNRATVDARATYGLTPLHLAVREYRPETVSALLQGGASVDAIDAFGCTPLHDAAGRGFPVVVAQLLQANANVNVVDSGGTTPLHRAARLGRTPTVNLLLKAGADRSTRNLTGRTPADEASSRGHEHLVPLLAKP
jgi:ankyrin repeat protein